MGNIKKLFLILFMFSCSVQAAQIKYDFASIQVGFADWDSGFGDKDDGFIDGDLMKLAITYGAILDKGELYVIYEHNHFEKSVDKRNYTLGAVGHYRLLDSDFTAFTKLWNKDENNSIDRFTMYYGFGYLGFASPKYYFKPYIALNHVSVNSNFGFNPEYGSANGHNGWMIGWMAGYNFNKNLSLSSWTDIQFDRNKAYTESIISRGHENGLSGGLTLSWKFNSNVSASLIYSYYLNEMGFDGLGDQLTYAVSYNF